MARASFSTLPLELKARIVEMTSDQEDAWRRRVKKAERAAAHINSLSALALVSRELRDLAAKHQFRVLSADRASLSVFRFRVLPRYGHLITTIRFYNSHAKEGSEYALSITGQLPALRSLAFQAGAATRLFGSGVTLKDDLEDEEASDRGSILKFLSPRIEALKLFDFEPSEAVGLVRACRNLKTLGLKGFPSPSSLAAYSRLVHSRGLDPSVLDRPHLTPFHPDAQLNYTENEVDFLEAVLGRTLTFGQLELKRMLAEGNVAKAVGWVAKLKALEEERLVWND
ncbi:hypothetical protein RQP46_010517 [Phenoliferia psychrophenolica]